jgi:hypothetical protein
VQTPRGMLLNDETQVIGGRDLALAPWLGGLAEVPFRLISRESSRGHGSFLCTTNASVPDSISSVLDGWAGRFMAPPA